MVSLGFFSHSVKDVITGLYDNYRETSRSPQNFNFYKLVSVRTSRPRYKVVLIPREWEQNKGRGILRGEQLRRYNQAIRTGYTNISTARVDPNPTVQKETDVSGEIVPPLQEPITKLTESMKDEPAPVIELSIAEKGRRVQNMTLPAIEIISIRGVN